MLPRTGIREKRFDGRRHGLLMAVLICTAFLLALPESGSSKTARESYNFERIWPTLQQPWYFRCPYGIAIDSNGNVYVADTDNHRIQKFTADGQFMAKWGTKGDENGQFRRPQGIAIDSNGNVYVVDSGNCRIQKFTSNGHFLTGWGSGGYGDSQFAGPRGIAIDGTGNVYVVDYQTNYIQKFTSDGGFLARWKNNGHGDGQLYSPYGVATDNDGNVYVADTGNNRIQKFSPDGDYIAQWGEYGTGEGQFDHPHGLVVDGKGSIYVADTGNCRIQQLSPSGEPVAQWGGSGAGDGRFNYPEGIALDGAGNVFVGDSGNNRIQKLSSDGRFMTKWGSLGDGDGELYNPCSIAEDPQGKIYVADTKNHRIQKFTPEGRYLDSWGSKGDGNGQFNAPAGIAIDEEGSVYVADTGNHRIQKLTNEGSFLAVWGSLGYDELEFYSPSSIATDSNGNVYVADTKNHRIQKLSSEGKFLDEFGGEGKGNGRFDSPLGIAVDGNGNIYVADTENHRIQKLSAKGKFIDKWGEEGDEKGHFWRPSSIATDSGGNVYVADTGNFRIQKLTSQGDFITQWGEFGSGPGQLNGPRGIVINRKGRAYVADSENNRIQVFEEVTLSSRNKAILVAGGGPYSANYLWEETEVSANFAHRTLSYQGFPTKSILYLTSDKELDLDSDGKPDDIKDATCANLQAGLKVWAKGADNVVIYLVDHGGIGTFTMKGGGEALTAKDLASWLTDLEKTITGKIILIYDACHAGSFLEPLASTSGRRIILASTSSNESAYFLNHGSISFSSYFWTQIFNGVNLADAFSVAKKAVYLTSKHQHPCLDANGDGKSQAKDIELVQKVFIGNHTSQFCKGPQIAQVCPPQTIHDTTDALLYADGVTSDDGIARVWAMVRPPDFRPGPAGNPVSGLPTVDLIQKGEDAGHFEAAYSNFVTRGIYQIAIYAMDRKMNISIPQLTSVTVDSPLSRKVILVAGGAQSDPLWPAVEKGMKSAYNALRYQGYAKEDIRLLSPAYIPGVDHETSLASPGGIRSAIQEAQDQTLDLVLYMVGNGKPGSYAVNPSEDLAATDLKEWLDSIQEAIPGPVTILYDAPFSESFLPSLIPPEGKKRVSIASTGKDSQAYFAPDGDVSFSQFFWNQVANGANLREAFLRAKTSSRAAFPSQVAAIDDNGNGKGNEGEDGALARTIMLGSGIVRAGDAPVIGSVCKAKKLTGEASAVIWAKRITATAAIEKVWAVITPPGYSSRSFSSTVTGLPTLSLKSSGKGVYKATYRKFTAEGTYNIAILAMDKEGAVSLPKATRVLQSSGKVVFDFIPPGR